MNSLSAKDFLKQLENEFGDKVESKLKEEGGASGKKVSKIWLEIDRENLSELISFFFEFQTPHFTSMFGRDLVEEDKIEISYHFSLFYDERLSELSLIVSTPIPKDDLWLPTITDKISGALTTEREMKEMFGIEIKDIPDDRHVYLPYDHPEDEYPWRKDEYGVGLEDVYEKEGQK
ncbi:hypothetical protein C9439_04600 [archaeon SCG-AAA382B04]|nr:hypothetical protein C9439_04600 [archaeon SCG-AAA382B04]